MTDLKDRFVLWFRLTHWQYRPEWLHYDDGRFTHPETQAMYVAYRAGFNRAKKESRQ